MSPIFFASVVLNSIWLVTIAIFPVMAQRDQGGFIAPGDSLRKLMPNGNMIYLPSGGFTFYEVPHGDFKGKILPGPPLMAADADQEPDTLMTSTITGPSIQPLLLGSDSFFLTSDNRFYLTFDQQRDQHVLVFSQSYQGWIPLEEIQRKGFVLVYWMEFYGETKGQLIHSLQKIAAIRSGPYHDAPVVEMADELFSEIRSTGKCEGPYCKVEVIQYNNPFDQTKSKEENISKRYKGWMQIIDEEGKPLVAHHLQGF